MRNKKKSDHVDESVRQWRRHSLWSNSEEEGKTKTGMQADAKVYTHI